MVDAAARSVRERGRPATGGPPAGAAGRGDAALHRGAAAFGALGPGLPSGRQGGVERHRLPPARRRGRGRLRRARGRTRGARTPHHGPRTHGPRTTQGIGGPATSASTVGRPRRGARSSLRTTWRATARAAPSPARATATSTGRREHAVPRHGRLHPLGADGFCAARGRPYVQLGSGAAQAARSARPPRRSARLRGAPGTRASAFEAGRAPATERGPGGRPPRAGTGGAHKADVREGAGPGVGRGAPAAVSRRSSPGSTPPRPRGSPPR